MSSTKPDVLIINSYAGSLTIAALNAGFQIRGSYEDAGYGLKIQQANFPNLNYREKIAGWPTQDLSETIVLAHPPCAAFSQQNTSKSARGTDTEKFRCTVNVLDYAFKNKALALAIESVPAALDGARAVHDEFAEKYGYDVFRILQNAATFACPQWRPRFWILFIRRGVIGTFHWNRPSDIRLLHDVVTFEGTTDPVLDGHFIQQHRVLTNFFGEEECNKLLSGQYGSGSLPSLLKKHMAECKSQDGRLIAKTYCVMGNFMSHCLRVLDENGLGTTLLFDSWWCMNGKVLTVEDYCAVMGFPRKYIFPTKYLPKFREFLSRGVCPPIAQAILEELWVNLNRKTYSADFTQKIEPGQTMDLNPRKAEIA